MKKSFIMLALLLLFSCSPVLCAADEEDQFFADGFYYYLKDFNGTTGAVICGSDTEWDHVPAEGETWPEIIIPSIIAGVPVYGVEGVSPYEFGPDKVVVSEGVKYIYEGAFASAIGEISLPSTVEYIADGAFAEYDGAYFVSIHPDNPYYVVKDKMVLTKDLKDLIYCFANHNEKKYMEEITIPSYVETVHSYSFLFDGVARGRTIIFSDGVKKIQPLAVWWSCGLPSAYFPESIEYIAPDALEGEGWIETLYFMGSKIPTGAEEFLKTTYFQKLYVDYAERDDLCFENTETATPEDLEAFLALIRDGKLDEAADPENYVRISEPEEQPTQTQPPATPQTEDGEMAELQEKSSLAVTLSAVLAIGVIATVVVVKKRK